MYRPSTSQNLIAQVCDIMRGAGNCTGAMQYVPELTWLLFLRILDEREQTKEQQAAALAVRFEPTLVKPYRWRDWAAPTKPSGDNQGNIRQTLEKTPGGVTQFVNKKLLPHLRGLRQSPSATPRQKIVSAIMSGIEKVSIATETSLLDIIERVDRISMRNEHDGDEFNLSRVYEDLLQKMGDKKNDGGQFFTPRDVIKAIIRTIDPKIGETVHDPCCGTGGFLAQCFEYVMEKAGDSLSPSQQTMAKHEMFSGREKENLIFPIALANLVLHGIDHPKLWHGNTLTENCTYEGLYEDVPLTHDIILTNPPFGGKEGKEAQLNFDYQNSSTQLLFLQHVIKHLSPTGRCGIVVDEGLLFRTSESTFVDVKRKLTNECNLWCVVSLPANVFVTAGTSVKTNILFFRKGEKTKKIWYYDLSHRKVTKTNPLLLSDFDDFFEKVQGRTDSDVSWTVDLVAKKKKAKRDADALRAQAKKKEADAIEHDVYDLKASNPNRNQVSESRTPQELLDVIEEKEREIGAAIRNLRDSLQLGVSFDDLSKEEDRQS